MKKIRAILCLIAVIVLTILSPGCAGRNATSSETVNLEDKNSWTDIEF